MESERRRKKYFELAKKLSEKSKYHHKLGAVVVKKGKILGVGFNQPEKTHPKSPNPFKTIHCELDAIIGISKEDLQGASIYIYRQYKDGSPAMAAPCRDCRNLIKHVGIKKVFHTGNRTFEEFSND